MSVKPAQALAAGARVSGSFGGVAPVEPRAGADQAAAAEQMTSRVEVQCCPHCSASTPARWGKSHRGRQRWQCKGCERTFSATTRTIVAGLHEPEKVDAVLDDMLAPVPRSCRKLGAALGLDKMTVWSWRRKLSARLALGTCDIHAEPVAVARTSVRDSRKASREWVNHARDPMLFPKPDRLRWVDYRRLRLPLPQPMARYRIAIEAAVAEMGTCCAVTLATISPTLFDGAVVQDTTPHIEHRQLTLGVSIERPSIERTEWLESSNGLPLPATGIGSGCALPQSSIVEPLIAQLELFLRPFRSPATKYLGGYVAWFVARLPGGGRGHRESVRRQLFGVGSTRDPDSAERHAAHQAMAN